MNSNNFKLKFDKPSNDSGNVGYYSPREKTNNEILSPRTPRTVLDLLEQLSLAIAGYNNSQLKNEVRKRSKSVSSPSENNQNGTSWNNFAVKIDEIAKKLLKKEKLDKDNFFKLITSFNYDEINLQYNTILTIREEENRHNYVKITEEGSLLLTLMKK